MKILNYLLLLLPSLSFAQDSTMQKLDDLLQVYNSNGHFNGSVLVARKGVILLQKGYGIRNAENKTWLTPESIYQIASVTKTFTSAIPSLPISNPAHNGITATRGMSSWAISSGKQVI